MIVRNRGDGGNGKSQFGDCVVNELNEGLFELIAFSNDLCIDDSRCNNNKNDDDGNDGQ